MKRILILLSALLMTVAIAIADEAGYHVVGGINSTAIGEGDVMVIQLSSTVPAGAVIHYVYMYCDRFDSAQNDNIQVCIYSDIQSSPSVKVAYDVNWSTPPAHGSPTWLQCNPDDLNYTIPTSTKPWIGFLNAPLTTGGFGIDFWRNAGTWTRFYSIVDTANGILNNPFTDYSNRANDRKYSMYVTYTTSSGDTVATPVDEMIGTIFGDE